MNLKFMNAGDANEEIKRLRALTGDTSTETFFNVKRANKEIERLEKLTGARGVAIPAPASLSVAGPAKVKITVPAPARRTLLQISKLIFPEQIASPDSLSDKELATAVEKAAFQFHVRLPYMAADAVLAQSYARSAPVGTSRITNAMKQVRCNDILILNVL